MIYHHTAHLAESLQTNVWNIDPTAAAGLVILALGYMYVLGPLRAKFALGPDPEWWRAPAFGLGSGLIWPGNLLADRLYR